MGNSPWSKPIAWAVCIIGGNIAGNLINHKYFGSLEGTVAGLALGGFVTTFIDVQQLDSMSNQQNTTGAA